MIPITIADFAAVVNARVVTGDAANTDDVTGVVTDSRQVVNGDIYIARRGDHADGADFAHDAMAAGAVAVVASHPIRDLPTLVVDDPDRALTDIAVWVRDTASCKVVAVTGSVGKTTTKDLAATTLGASRNVVAAVGSHNNEVGVPLTVTRTTLDTQVLVTELGARGVGQVAQLGQWLRPDVAVVTAVAGVHLELFGSLDQVAVAKGELVESLGPGGVAVLNGDDPRVAAMADLTSGRVMTVSARGRGTADLVADEIHLDAHARASFVAVTPWGQHRVTLPIAGQHHVGNALLALAVTGAVGADVGAAAAALATASVSTGRSRVIDTNGVVVVDDSYNANPTSTVAALDTLAAMHITGARVAVLGVMAEIGQAHAQEHRRVGAHAAGIVDRLVVVGAAASELAAGARSAGLPDIVQVDDVEDAIAVLRSDPLVRGDGLLVKASRVSGLDRVVDVVTAVGTMHPGGDA